MTSITVYSKPSCVQCSAVKRHLAKKNVDYTEVDITQDSDAFHYVVSQGFTQAPIVDMGEGTLFSGYRPDVIDKVLSQALTAA